jgi:hypothetical protein
MAYGETKVYFDGSHYIAIPHTTRPSKKRYKPPEETVEVKDETNVKTKETDTENNEMDSTLSDLESVPFEVELEEIEVDELIFEESEPFTEPDVPRRATRKELFNEFYKEAQDMSRSKRKSFLISIPSSRRSQEPKVRATFRRSATSCIARAMPRE